MRSSDTAAKQLVDVVSGICVWWGNNCTILDFYVVLVEKTYQIKFWNKSIDGSI